MLDGLADVLYIQLWAQDCRFELVQDRMSVKMPCHAEVRDTGIGIEILMETPGIFRPARTCPPLQIAQLKVQVNCTPVLPLSSSSLTIESLLQCIREVNTSQSNVIQIEEIVIHDER